VTEVELRSLLDSPGLGGLFRAVREALEMRPNGTARSAKVAVGTEVERRAIADLLGWKELPGARVRIRLDELDRALRASKAEIGLLDAVVLLGGPVRNRRAERCLASVEREAMWEAARTHPRVAGRVELVAWLDALRSSGLVGRAARAAEIAEPTLLAQAVAVAARLPAAGTMLAVLASEETGDSHALDPGRALSALVLRAAAALAGWSVVPSSAAERRRLWAAVGVACDPLSTDVLTLGLRPSGSARLARHLRESSDDGEPRRITLRELAAVTLDEPRGMWISVCENPSVVAAVADRLSFATGPLVCLDGIPSTAALVLLRQLTASGARIRFRADFDWAGIRIGNIVRRQVPGAAPWRFSEADYRRTLEAVGDAIDLAGAPVTASWDGGLTAAMGDAGTAIQEERLLADLLSDLATAASGLRRGRRA
jgi:uncharacterized protein (TIGR02679 family)